MPRGAWARAVPGCAEVPASSQTALGSYSSALGGLRDQGAPRRKRWGAVEAREPSFHPWAQVPESLPALALISCLILNVFPFVWGLFSKQCVLGAGLFDLLGLYLETKRPTTNTAEEPPFAAGAPRPFPRRRKEGSWTFGFGGTPILVQKVLSLQTATFPSS